MCKLLYYIIDTIVGLFFLSPVTDQSTIQRYFARFDERFFQYCDKELAKINTFFSGNN